uniref:Uncharacterized protein n=1 Tax=Cyanothece sp. (strain PCC 7425 / ATCC 29141) TaxID=395961 RepID=B8HYP8_CYAP4
MMDKTTAAVAIVLVSLAVHVKPGLAQSPGEIIKDLLKNPGGVIPNLPVKRTAEPPIDNSDGSITRAMNLARQAAEKANGGLNNYRAEPSMYGPSEKSPFVYNPKTNTLTFTFLGGRPAQPPTIQSIVTVARDGSSVVMDYNGPIRTAN